MTRPQPAPGIDVGRLPAQRGHGGTTGTPAVLRVAIIDDHHLLADALTLALRAQQVSGWVPALDDREALVSEVVRTRPDLVLLDLDLGRLGDGTDLVRPFVQAGLRVLVVSATTDPVALARVLQRGAVGVLDKSGRFSDLVTAVAAAVRGQELMTPEQRLRLLDEARRQHARRRDALAPFALLSPREADVLRELCDGRSVALIARAAVVAEATVRSQVRAILTKLGVGSQLEAVALAHRVGWH